MLDLTKGQVLDLKKEDGSSLSKIRVGLSWDVSEGKSMDLDLFVHHKDSKKTAYFGEKKAIEGVILSDDNTTGEGDGDDEFVKMDAVNTADGDYFICVNIYNAKSKGQKLEYINNAVCSIYNDETNEKLAEYKMTENGGDNEGIVVGVVSDKGDGYTFTAKGVYVKGDINEIVASL